MNDMAEYPQLHPILLFDGVCNFCDGSVKFIIKRDPKKIFRFASIQSEAGKNLLMKFCLPINDLNTMVMIEGDKYYTKSSAAIQITKKLSGLWPVLCISEIIPKRIRDRMYDCLARNRYKWFGKKETCMIPSRDLRDRFLE